MAGKIDVIGLGAGDLDQLPLGIYKQLKAADQVIMTRTVDHPVMKTLQDEGLYFESYDAIYQEEEHFLNVYERIVDDLLQKAQGEHIIYAVPGHPMLAEKTVQLLLRQNDVEASIMGGQSYLDALFTSLKIDPIEGFQFVDGTDFRRDELQYRQHLIICQVYDQFVASDVKLTLLEDLPFDYEVTIVEAAGSEGELIRTVPLEMLDHELEMSNLTSIYVPPVPKHLLNHTFPRLREVIAMLRGPEGCAWDKAQTHDSLKEYLIEEAYEVIDAIDEQDEEGMVEELGDVLLQVMLHSQIGEDEAYFTVDDVIESITNKMIHRHPHVFSNQPTADINEINMNWDQLKKEEKGERESVLDGIPNHLPSLHKAYKLQQKAARVGFDWEHAEEIWQKLNEEIDEVSEAIQSDDREEIMKEFGDVLFVIANLTRFYKMNPELALEATNQKFISRFAYIEEKLKMQEKDINQATLEEMDGYWNEAKRNGGRH